MEIWKESQLKKLSTADNIDNAFALSLNFFNNLGYEYCAFKTTPESTSHYSNTLDFNNYPHEWNHQYEEKHFVEIDPVVAHCNQSSMPILWSEHTFAKTPDLWQALQGQGLQHGWTQAIHDPVHNTCSMFSLARSHCAITPYELYENLGYAIFASHTLHNLVALKGVDPHRLQEPTVHLSPREIEVLRWSARGKTAAEAARILNLAERTVNFHISSAIKKLKVNNKISAVIAASKVGAI